ncbi:MAG: hypothetical protein GEV07_12700 [Streptosporangiales bacterium]|nr:hypothetical protein [Streptosporangiales bacterium]
MPKVIVPVGMMLGEYFRVDGQHSSSPEFWHVSVGGYAEQLNADEVKVWASAMVEPERQAKLEGTRELLLDTVRKATKGVISRPGKIVDELIERGLLIEFDPVEGDVETIARKHRLFPLGVGMGNSGDDPLMYRIAVGSEPRIGVNGDVYALWSNSLYYLNLWQSCQQFAKEMNQYVTPGGDMEELDAESVMRELAVNIPLLVSAECAFLDPVAA